MTSRVRVPRRCGRGRALLAAAALAGGSLAGGSLLATPAAAEPAGTVTFSGGCGLLGSGLGARSSPDVGQVNLPAGTELRFANRLGQPAMLRLDGAEAVEVPAGGNADVVFHDGPVQATMQISCLLGEPAGAVTVAVSPAPRVGPASPAPSAGGAGSAGSGAGSSGAGSGGSGSGPDRGPSQPAGSWWSAPPAGPGAPAAGEEATGGRPPAELPSPADELSPRWGLATDPSDSGGGSGGPANVDAQPAGGERAAGALTRTSGSVPGSGPIGLLALVATVCVVGVSAGAVRALIGQRAARAAIGLK